MTGDAGGAAAPGGPIPVLAGDGITARRGGRVLVAAATFLLLAVLASFQGGYFPSSWGWAALATCWAIGLWAILGGRVQAGPFDWLVLGALVALLGWVAASTSWSLDPAQSMLEVERTILFVTAVAAFLLLARRSGASASGRAIALAIGLVSLYSLGARLFPNRLGSYDPVAVNRLSDPIGYWNGLGILCVVGTLLCWGFALHGRAWARLIAALAPVVLLPTLYFTYSRGAWIALGCGVVALLSLSRERLRLVTAGFVLLPVPIAATLISSETDALTHQGVPLKEAVGDGQRLAVTILALLALQLLLGGALLALEGRVRIPARVRTGYALVLLAGAAVVLVLVFARFGGPVTIAERGYEAFKAPPPQASPDLNERLKSFSGNGRAELWAGAWDQYREHPLLGSGAGSYERYWLRTRANPIKVRDAHGLYIEMLAELGPLGLLLLVVALGTPVAAFLAGSRAPWLGGALAGYVAFLIHAGVDWDWELSAVTLAGLLCGGLLVVAGRRGEERDAGPALRTTALAGAVAAGAVSLVGLVGNNAFAAAEVAIEERRWVQAERAAARAEWWMPWSSSPWLLLAQARLGRGDEEGALAGYRKAVEIDRDDWRAWSELAVVARGEEKALAVSRATALNPLEPSVIALGAPE